jgi:hypothetical protein
MNLEKTINKNIFNMSSAIHNSNPLVPDRIKSEYHEQHDSSLPTPLSSILTNPKQKLTTQFKRAITMIKQRSDPSQDQPSTSSLPPQMTTNEKSADSTILTSLIEEPMKHKYNVDSMEQISSTSTLTPKSQSFVNAKSQPSRSSSNQVMPRTDTDLNNSLTSTILTMDPLIIRPNHPTSPSARMVKQSLQQIHSSILQTMHQHHPLSPAPTSSSSATLSPTSTSSSTTGTGEVTILETIL